MQNALDIPKIISLLDAAGYGEELDWQRNLKECDNCIDFRNETIWVILNSGMKEQIARKIYNRVWEAIAKGDEISTVFKHVGKVKAIEFVFDNCSKLFLDYLKSEDKISFLKTIPFIGNITCFHLAKNLGHDCVKPDRHLVRVSAIYRKTPDELCAELAERYFEKKATIDIIIWRACNLGIL